VGPLSLFRTYTYGKLRRAGVKSLFSMLPGTFLTAFEKEAMANKKFENFKEFRQLYPEYRFVFTGDSGQGDPILGGKMFALMKEEEEETKVKHGGEVTVLIHDVCKKNNTPITDQKGRDGYAKNGIHFYDSYVTAALISYESKLISEEGLLYVMTEAQKSFDQIHFTDENMKKAREKELHAAVESCHKFLESQKKKDEKKREKEEKDEEGKKEEKEEVGGNKQVTTKNEEGKKEEKEDVGGNKEVTTK